MRGVRYFIFCFFCCQSFINAEPRFEADFWAGYNFPLNQSIRDQCSLPSTGNSCQIGGISFGTGLYAASFGPVRAGVGLSYLPISDGTLRISDTVLVNIGASYAPVLFLARYDIGPIHIQLGSGYAMTIERPRAYSGQPISTIDSGTYAASTEIGFRVAISAQSAFYTAFKHFILVPISGGNTIHNLVPSVGFQVNLAD